MARECRKLICEAPDDGRPMIHFLSPTVEMMNGSFFKDMREQARKWITAQINTFQMQQNEHLCQRYLRLSRYFDIYGESLTDSGT